MQSSLTLSLVTVTLLASCATAQETPTNGTFSELVSIARKWKKQTFTARKCSNNMLNHSQSAASYEGKRTGRLECHLSSMLLPR